MSSKIAFVLYLFCQFSFGQIMPRMPLHAQIVSDSIQMKSGNVVNITSKKTTFISDDGFFDILVHTKDTLIIQGPSFKTRKWIVKEGDFAIPLIMVKVETAVNHLQEVLVPRTIKPNLGDIQGYIDTPYFDDSYSSPENTTMPYYTIPNGMDFVKIGKLVAGLFQKEPEKKELDFYENFSEAAYKCVKPEFFTNALQLKEHQVGLFIIFCENDPKSKTFLKRESKFELTDFLITKSVEFKKIIALQK